MNEIMHLLDVWTVRETGSSFTNGLRNNLIHCELCGQRAVPGPCSRLAGLVETRDIVSLENVKG